MSLETITGNLRDGYNQLQPGTMLHVDELMKERRDNHDLRNQWFYTADGEVYLLYGARKTPTLVVTREAHNPVLQNIDDAFTQLAQKHIYRPNQSDVQQALAASDTVLIFLSNLRLSKYDSECSYLPLGTTPAKYTKLNDDERTFAERVYGQGGDFVRNMKMLKMLDISETRLWVLNPDYVREHAEEGALARASWLYSFNYGSQFNADDRYINNRGRVRGVRRGSVAVGGAQKNEGPYRTAAPNVFKAHYDALLVDPEGAIKAMNDLTAAGLLELVSKYINSKQ